MSWRDPTADMKYDFSKSAGQGWIDEAKKFGLTVSKTPMPGAIVVWGHPNNIYTGHVAIVEAVEENGDVIVTSGSYYTSPDRFRNELVGMNFDNEVAQRTFHFK